MKKTSGEKMFSAGTRANHVRGLSPECNMVVNEWDGGEMKERHRRDGLGRWYNSDA